MSRVVLPMPSQWPSDWSAYPAAGGGGAGGALDFAVDWGTATGSTQNARTDGGKLADKAYVSTVLSVVARTSISGAPTDWPTNMLRVEYNGDGQLVGNDAGDEAELWAARPAVGEYYFGRFLLWVPTTARSSDEHGQQSGLGSIQHCFQVYANNSSTFSLGFSSTADTHLSTTQYRTDNGTGPIPMAKPIRVEWRLHRNASGTAQALIKIFNEDVSKIVEQWDTDDFLENYGGGPNSLLDNNPSITINDVAQAYGGYIFGSTGNTSAGHVFVGGAAFRISASSSDWIGAYVAGEAD